jgi:hypothetical protein
VNRGRLDPEHAGIHFRVIEDVVDDAQEQVAGMDDLVEDASGLAVVALGTFADVRQAEHAVQRRTDLVTHVGQEFALHPGQALRFVACRLESSRSCFDQVFEMVPVLFEFGSHRLALGNIGDETMPQRFTFTDAFGCAVSISHLLLPSGSMMR